MPFAYSKLCRRNSASAYWHVVLQFRCIIRAFLSFFSALLKKKAVEKQNKPLPLFSHSQFEPSVSTAKHQFERIAFDTGLLQTAGSVYPYYLTEVFRLHLNISICKISHFVMCPNAQTHKYLAQ